MPTSRPVSISGSVRTRTCPRCRLRTIPTYGFDLSRKASPDNDPRPVCRDHHEASEEGSSSSTPGSSSAETNISFTLVARYAGSVDCWSRVASSGRLGKESGHRTSWEWRSARLGPEMAPSAANGELPPQLVPAFAKNVFPTRPLAEGTFRGAIFPFAGHEKWLPPPPRPSVP